MVLILIAHPDRICALYRRDHRRFIHIASRIKLINQFTAHHRPSTIMYGDLALLAELRASFNKFNSILHALEPAVSTLSDLMRNIEIKFFAEFIPKGKHLFGKDEDNFRIGLRSRKFLQGMHQDGFFIQLQKLLREISSEPRACSGSNDDDKMGRHSFNIAFNRTK